MVAAVGPQIALLAPPGGCFPVPHPCGSLQKPIGLDGSVLGIDDDGSGFTTAVSALDIYSLCKPARDATVLCTELETVLQERFGDDPGSTDGMWFPGLLGTSISRKRVDFLSFWLGLGRHLADDLSISRPDAPYLLSTIRGMECFGHGVLKYVGISRNHGMLPSQDLICLLQEVRTCAQDPLYWDEVIAAVPDDKGLMLSLPEVAEAVHVWLKDCVRAEVDGSEIDSPYVSPLIGSNRTSTVSLHASPTTAQAFSAWAGAAAPNSDDSSQVGSICRVESSQGGSQFTLSEDTETQSGSTPVTASSAEQVEVAENYPELQQAENAAEILFSHVNATKSAQVQEAMRCLSTAHEAISLTLCNKAAENKELHDSLDRLGQYHSEELEKLRELHKTEIATLVKRLTSTKEPTRKAKEPTEGWGGKCVLCLDGSTSHASVPCGHLAFCGACAAARPSPVCPVCRQPSQCVVRIFKP